MLKAPRSVRVVETLLQRLARSRQLKSWIYPLLDPCLQKYGELRGRRYELRQTIVVASSPRGGSTWLAEILLTIPGYHLLWEPLHLNNNPNCIKYGFDWVNYLPTHTRAPEKRRYMEDVLSGRDLSTRLLTSLSIKPNRLLFLRGYIIKCVNVNLMLSWLLREFPVRTLLLIRHPCAVVASQLAHPGWRRVTREDLGAYRNVKDEYPQFEEAFQRAKSHEEVLAVVWGMQTHVPLSQPPPHRWCLVTYERLVDKGKDQLEKIFDYLREPVPQGAYRQLRVPSATAGPSINLATGHDRLTGWKNRLTPKQIGNVLSIVRSMGINYYNEDIHPNNSELARTGG